MKLILIILLLTLLDEPKISITNRTIGELDKQKILLIGYHYQNDLGFYMEAYKEFSDTTLTNKQVLDSLKKITEPLKFQKPWK